MPYFDPSGFIYRIGDLMIYLQAHFDESGKVHDQDVASFCGFVASNEQWHQCFEPWNRLLFANGIAEFKAQKALRYRTELSDKVSAKGVEARISAISPFIREIRKAVGFGIGIAVDCHAFKNLPEADRLTLKDPHLWAFQAACIRIQRVAEQRYANETDIKFCLCCDEEESYAQKFIRLFTKIRTIHPDMRRQFVSIAFADDKHFFQLQAADLIASLVRQEANHVFHGAPFDMRGLYEVLCADDSSLAPVEIKMLNGELLSGIARAERGGPKKKQRIILN